MFRAETRNSKLVSALVFFATFFATLLGVSAQPSVSRAEAEQKKGYKFSPVRGEDWPESGESDGRNPQPSDDEDADHAPEPEGSMPKMKMRPDGTIDPDSFKGMF